MKNILESKLKKFIRKTFGLDLTDNIEMITSVHDIPYEFQDKISNNNVRYALNTYGPIFLFRVGKDLYLYQSLGKGEYWIMGEDGRRISEQEFIDRLGLSPLGMTIEDLINEYFKEDLTESLSREELYSIKWKRFETFMKRRDSQIKELISHHTHAYKYDIERYDEDIIVIAVRNLVVSDFIINNDLNIEDSFDYDWVYEFIKDEYTDYIKKDLGL